eukprot:5168663-Amphidinium_carterae.1
MHEGSRRLLGRHVKPKDHSVVIYSRDALARLLRGLGTLYGQILDETFHPDRTRSGYYTSKQPESHDGEVVDAVAADDVQTSSDEAKGGEAEKTGTDEEAHVAVRVACYLRSFGPRVAKNAGLDVFRHKSRN